MTVIPPTPDFYSGCLWPIDPGCDMEKWESYDEAVQLRSLALASSLLSSLTAGRVTNCPVTIRPCFGNEGCWTFGPDYRMYGVGMHGFFPNNWNGRWSNAIGGSCTSGCEIDLPGPVGRIDEIKVDGELLDLSDFRVDNGHILVWQGGGECPLPRTQDLSKRDTEPGTFSITYLRGYPVDLKAAQAVTLLALEFAKACTSDRTCALPRNAVSVARAGVSFEIDQSILEEGRTGIERVDAWVTLYRPPGSPRRPSMVMSPDLPRHRFTGPSA